MKQQPSQKTLVCAPAELKASLGQQNRQFRSNDQNDAQELLRCLLDSLSRELNRVKEKPKYEELDFDSLPLREQSNKWWQYMLKREDSIMTDIF
jgi:ubiquitin C-terminal hydrolase